MPTSLKRQSLSKPRNGDEISLYSLGFVRARNKNKIHSLLLEALHKSGLTKSDLAKRLNKRPEQITRWLSEPGNLTLDTLSDLVFALRGDFIKVSFEDALSKEKSNQRVPDWLCRWHPPADVVTLEDQKTHGRTVVSLRATSGSETKVNDHA